MSNQQDSNTLFLGNTPLNNSTKQVSSEVTTINGTAYFKIANFDAMPAFFMTLVSDNDQWMFLGSNGGITAGRKNPEQALFPYYTDDKLLDNASNTGSVTVFRVLKGEKRFLWEPFTHGYSTVYNLARNLYKSKFGNSIIFEEFNHDLALQFRYEWAFSARYGFVRTCQLTNLSGESCTVEVLDGIQNLLPAGIDSHLQANRSTLADAYKKNELDEQSGLGVFTLSSRIVDRAEPSEALEATTVWSHGLEQPLYCTSAAQLEAFRNGATIEQEPFTKANKAAFLTNAQVNLKAQENKEWLTVAEVCQSTAKVMELQYELVNNSQLVADIQHDIQECTRHLRKLVGIADGHQSSNDFLASARHYSNVLFNIMRGGVYEQVYRIEKSKFLDFLDCWNQQLLQQQFFFEQLPDQLSYQKLIEAVEQTENKDLQRLTLEFLPLSFSRRHGDPSRPWNYFNIDIHDKFGSKKLSYEGNWRDIFQNWEALTFSFPEYIFGIIAKFLNASTIDGYNPYRITNDGIDWEVIEPNDPWSYIGYWGDHQIIYLQKLLEIAHQHYPGKLQNWLDKSFFVYANVPYRIKSYGAIKSNPYDTVDFDQQLELEIEHRVDQVGADGKLIWSNEHRILNASLFEKLLLTLLTKLYNFVPDGGIWLNTQRPEWNDANNALVGHGTSLVTLHYIRRYVLFLKNVLDNTHHERYEINTPLAQLLHSVGSVFHSAQEQLQGFTPHERERFIDELGLAGEKYRNQVYAHQSLDCSTVDKKEVVGFLQDALNLIDATLKNNKREDGLHHAYNLLQFKKDGAHIAYLYEMLEGQVAALSSGFLSVAESRDLLNALKNSAMYREDQYSYMLYPDRVLPRFLTKNIIPADKAEANKIIQYFLEHNDSRIVERSALGTVHFSGEITNFKAIKERLHEYAEEDEKLEQLLSTEEIDHLEVLFEELFNHHAFTGRSGTFYGYEGLGSIYWHMVSKLLLAVQETIFRGHHTDADRVVLGELMDHYYEIRAGIGINKSPDLYGAFPTDPYSHTPGNAGAQQPGMTGQVKEDVINRWAELGVRIFEGTLRIEPILFHKEELLKKAEEFRYFDALGQEQVLEVDEGQMAFTYAGVPFIYTLGEADAMEIQLSSGELVKQNELRVPTELTSSIFKREGHIRLIKIYIT